MFCLKTLRRFLRTEDGVTAIEYGIIASLIAVVIITAVTLVGTDLTRTFDNVAASFPSSGLYMIAWAIGLLALNFGIGYGAYRLFGRTSPYRISADPQDKILGLGLMFAVFGGGSMGVTVWAFSIEDWFWFWFLVGAGAWMVLLYLCIGRGRR